MDKLTLNNLITSSRSNDQKAFRKIVEEYQYMVYSLSFRLLCDEEEAKDIVQETFLRVWTKLSTYQSDKKFSTWIYAIATNLCLDKLKSSKYGFKPESIDEQVNSLISTENADKKLLNCELGSLIQNLTNELTPKQKVVFTLRCIEELEIDEIIHITGMTAEKIKSNLFLARHNIQQKLENYGK